MENNKILLQDLEVDLWEQCNLRCAQCTHSSPYFTSVDQNYELEQFKQDVTNLSKVAQVDVFRIVGGEPLMNKNLTEYVKFLRESNIANYITIFTNGLVLSHTNNEVFNYIDRLRISVYNTLEEKKLKAIYANIEKIQELYPHLDVVANEISHFSYFNLATKNTNQELVKKIYDNCYYSYEHKGFSIFNGRLYKCFASRKKYNFLKVHSKENNFEHLKENLQDSIAIKDLQCDELKAFTSVNEPLEGCKWCLGTCGSQIKHSQVQPKTEDPATLDHLNFDAGKSYLSNLLLSWSLNDPKRKNIFNNKYFSIKHIKEYLKYFQFRTKQI